MGATPTLLHYHYSSLIVTLGLLYFGSFYSLTMTSPLAMVEICDNGIDDDGDGLIDLNDPDCVCPVIEPKSLIPNPSFEEQRCCPMNRSELNCAEGWIQASEATTDFIHTCGWMGWEDFPVPMPIPDGNGVMGFRDGRVFQEDSEPNWKEYAGACLNSPLKANVSYRFEFHVGLVDPEKSPSIDITFFGAPDCADLPFGVGDGSYGCPTNGPNWVRLGFRQINPGGQPQWYKTSIDVTPKEDIYTIAIGPPCRPTTSNRSTYYFFDNLVLADLRSFEFVISETTHPCADDFSLQVPLESGLEYQWYKNGIALLGETTHQLSKSHGEGDYQVRILGEDACRVTKTYTHKIPVIHHQDHVTLCPKDALQFGPAQLTKSGSYNHTFISKDGCDSIVDLQLEAIKDEVINVDAKIFEGERYEIGSWGFGSKGTHRATLMSSIGCDSLVDVHLSYYNFYQPNIFSPNGDRQNDYFNVIGNEDLIEISQLTIFDRWGTEVYQADNLIANQEPGWDGTSYNLDVNPGVYTYVAKIIMDDGLERTRSGSVMLVR